MNIITTQRLIIRHFKEEDAAALFGDGANLLI